MTRLALGLKCGDFGARGFEPVGEVAPIALSSCKRDESAIEPSPTPHCRKNQRRVMSRAYSERRSFERFTEFMGRKELVMTGRNSKRAAENPKPEWRNPKEVRNPNGKDLTSGLPPNCSED